MLETTTSIVEASPVTQGALIVVVGPSGAGKDSLINYARERLAMDPTILFVRRAVTRPRDGVTEDHDSLSLDAFAAAVAQDRFAVTWEAHGLHYGLPVEVQLHVDAGGIAIANGSRQALPSILQTFAKVIVVHVTAKPDVLARRLAMRGREEAADIETRLRRSPPELAGCPAAIEIDNSDDLSRAGEALISLIQATKPH